jgi:hypothetical protein
MPDEDTLLNPKFIYVILGAFFMLATALAVCTGKVYGRFGVSSSRVKEPSDFWWGVAIYFLGGLLCFGTYLRSVFPETIFHPERWLPLK